MRGRTLLFAGIVTGIIAVGSVLAWSLARPAGENPVAAVMIPRPHVDHASLVRGQFNTGPEVTAACLSCHPAAASQVMATAHWSWLGEETHVPGHEGTTRIGKKNLINNFCIGAEPNLAKCTSCHAGYGWTDQSFDFAQAHNVDCLVCHDGTGTYRKGGGGLPEKGVDLLKVAQSVGRPSRENCGTCHFAGGGGDGVKHGDLDGSMVYPSPAIDAHMGKHNLACVDCHRTENHRIAGRSMSVSADDANRARCTDCHSPQPHAQARLNAHTSAVACETCHIPAIAVETPTKMSWDWSTAGQDRPDADPHEYLKIKGSFVYATQAKPEYAWWGGTSEHYLKGDRIDPASSTHINYPIGQRDDGRSKITPFKVHRGKQPYDTQLLHLLIPQTVGAGGYWTEFDWDKALRLGSAKSGLKYSGSYGFAPTEMWWPLSHMVATKDKALQCVDCHGDAGRLNWKRLGYDADPAYAGTSARPAAPTKKLEISTAATGEVFSPQRLSASTLNLAGKDGLDRPADVHAERLLECASCHVSAESTRNRPRHVPGAGPGCASCHTNTDSTHDWLPFTARHMASLSCESCHVPQMHAPAVQMVDRTLPRADGSALEIRRGVEGRAGDPASLITGYRPLLLARRQLDGTVKLAPHNVISTWQWVDATGAAVAEEQLRAAILGGNAYRPEIVAALDGDGDGRVSDEELHLDAPAKVEAVRNRLVAAGIRDPHIAAEARAVSIHHSIGGVTSATRDCAACHSSNSTTQRPMALAAYVPGGVLPQLVGDDRTQLTDRIIREGQGLAVIPAPMEKTHIAGADRWRLGDRIGLGAILLSALGAGIHGLIRVVAWRRRSNA